MVVSKILRPVFIIALALYVIGAKAVFAVSYTPPYSEQYQEGEADHLRPGDVAYIFHSGTADVKKNIKPGDVLEAYREDRFRQMHRVGSIKVLSDIDENFFKAVVVDGEITAGDIARKNGISCLITKHVKISE